MILIQAEGGVGKTTLARKWFEIQGLEYLELRVGTTPQNLNSVEDWVKIQLRDYFKENPEQNFMAMLEQLKSKLQTKKIGVLIDNIEPVLINGEFIETHHKYYVELLTLLADNSVNSVTLITSHESIYEHKIKRLQTFQIYELEGLNYNAWRQYFEKINITIDSDALKEMHHAYGGNAEIMKILAGDIFKKSKGELNAYWQDNREDLLRNRTLEQLVKHQFEKLKNDNFSAYKILCRLGCYRYESIPLIPNKGIICLLWDEPSEREKHRLITDLQDRSLLRINQGKYYLYETIRQEAITRLKLTDDWKKAHAEAGMFLSNLITNKSQSIIPRITYAKEINDPQKQMYINIDNAEKAAQQKLSQQENLALEVVYHAIEFYDTDSFEELRQVPDILDNAFLQAVTNMVLEYVNCYTILGINLYKFAINTQILGIIDAREGNYIESDRKIKYSQKSFKISLSFFQTALLIATKVKDDKLMSNVLFSLAGCHYFRGISLHQLGIFFYQITKYKESKETIEESKTNLEKSLQIFNQLEFNQQLEEVKQAVQSLEISTKCFDTFSL